MILPMIRYLEGHGVRFHYNTKVTNIEFELTGAKSRPEPSACWWTMKRNGWT